MGYKKFSFLQTGQTSSRAAVGNGGSFPRVKPAGTCYLHLVLRSRMVELYLYSPIFVKFARF
jgi:hypothetical protein